MHPKMIVSVIYLTLTLLEKNDSIFTIRKLCSDCAVIGCGKVIC